MGGSTEILRFSDYELDFARRELRRAGAPVDLQPTPLRVLLHLAEHRDRTVPRRELLDTIWPDAVVGDEALTTALAEARHAVGDDGAVQRVIRTRKGLGYRFVAEGMEGLTAPASHRRRSRRFAITAAGAVVLVCTAAAFRVLRPEPDGRFQPTLAVLPFENLTGDDATQRIADGLTEELAHVLGSGRAPDASMFTVVAGPSLSQARAEVGARALGNALGADHVIEGSVRRRGDRVRVIARLLSVEMGDDVWSGIFDEDADDSLRVEDVIAQRVAASLGPWHVAESFAANVGSPEEAKLVRDVIPLLFFNGTAAEAVEKSERAVASDPESWLAHALAAWGWSYVLIFEGGGHDEALPRIEAHAAKALELSPGDGVVAFVTAQARVLNLQWTAAEPYARRAAEADTALYGEPLVSLLMSTGRAREAVSVARIAAARVPMEPWHHLRLATGLFANGELDEAAQECARANELANGTIDYCGFILWQLGRRDEAATVVQRAYETNGLDTIAVELARLRAEGGPEAVWRGIGGAGRSRDPLNGAHMWRAVFLAQAGDASAALGELEAALASKDVWLPNLTVLPPFDPLRDELRFRRVIRELELTAYHAKNLRRGPRPASATD